VKLGISEWERGKTGQNLKGYLKSCRSLWKGILAKEFHVWSSWLRLEFKIFFDE